MPKEINESMQLWGGRFSQETNPIMSEFNRSFPDGKLMYREDLQGTAAYVLALHTAGILTADELQEINRGLEVILTEWESGSFQEKSGDEDIHTANERRLTEIVGKVGGKVHTGRSRNDQVSTDVRLYARKHLLLARQYLKDLITCLVHRARDEIDVLMPGYTHLQRAQPIRWAHLLSSYATQLTDDLQRLEMVLNITNRCPLGAGALAGNPYQIDRQLLADQLGFAQVIGNSLMVVGDRGFVTDSLYWGFSVASHLSRMAEDLILYSTAEFGFVKLSDAYSTGSSLMPQKKNPDSLELLRGKCGRLFGNLAGFMMTVKGLPSTYNKDLAEDKRALFDTLATIQNSLQISTGVFSTLSINTGKMRSALSTDMLATDLADYLVRKGVPFRECHNIVGRVVNAADELKYSGIDILSLEELKAIDDRFLEDVHIVFDFESSVEKKSARGGTARSAVIEQLDFIESKIADL
ncbi:LANO_0H25136g1_1 [Lachancea nothofagi CBS 11611]|uniref:argininosuccinate lyase n=1 Tax=Lachancea nothofagi CBS 11611 TaxID=1266666 RepID=A0A1G4KNX8_9SACH|nr:LANO_0H25136g1_1 [Lachancea nothofagi CBS 11611]